MTKTDIKLAKEKVLKCLTEDFNYRSKHSGRFVRNHALFDASEGYMIYTQMDLEMVMDAVVRGLYLALQDSSEPSQESSEC